MQKLTVDREDCLIEDIGRGYPVILQTIETPKVVEYNGRIGRLFGTVIIDPLKKQPTEPAQNAPDSALDKQDAVSKPLEGNSVATETSQPRSFETSNRGGRPKKEDGEKMSRVTRWRRQKEKQGQLL